MTVIVVATVVVGVFLVWCFASILCITRRNSPYGRPNPYGHPNQREAWLAEHPDWER